MRKIVMFNRVSADGFFSAADGGLDWAVPDDEIEKNAVAGLPASDTILFGRKTYEMFESFWPNAVDADPHADDRRSPSMAAMAKWINAATKIVFSKTRREVTWSGSRVVHEFDPGAIEAMKKEPGLGIMVFGSSTLVGQLTQHGLIDEYQFVVSPLLLGSGKSLLGGVKRTKLNLLDAKPTSAGNVVLRYARA